MGSENHTPQHVVRIDDELWEAFGRAAGHRNRSKVLRDFAAWYVGIPGAKPPKRPGEEGVETVEEPGEPAGSLAPQPHALYRFFDKYGELLYVGITMDLPARMGNHRREKPWWTDAAWIEIEHHDTRGAALDAERMAIKAEKPLYNVVHNDAAEVIA